MRLHFLYWFPVSIENKISVVISFVYCYFHFFTLDRSHSFGHIFHTFHRLPNGIDRPNYERGSRNGSRNTHYIVPCIPDSITRLLYCRNIILQHLNPKTYYWITSRHHHIFNNSPCDGCVFSVLGFQFIFIGFVNESNSMNSGYGSIYTITHFHGVVVNPPINIFHHTFCRI